MPQVFGKLPSQAQSWTTPGAIQSWEAGAHGILAHCSQALLSVQVLAANLVRLRLAPKGELAPRRSWAVTRDEAFPGLPVTIRETDETIELATAEITVQIQRSTCQIGCWDQQGRPFAQDGELGLGWTEHLVAGWKRIEPEEHFYGFGERTGLLDHRSTRKTNWTVDALDYSALTDEMYQAIPFFIALRPGLAYGVFLSTSCWSQFDLGARQPGIWQMTAQTRELDYYLIYGPTPDRILQTYTELTGRMPLPPKWAIGYHQCRWSYDSEEEVRQLAQEFRHRRIPCDVIHLDIDYMRGYRVFTWSPRRFPDPARLLQDLQQQGFKTVTIVDPGVKFEPEADYPVYDEGLDQDFFVRKADGQIFHGYVWPDKAVFPDFLRPEVRQWWGNWQRTLTDAGVAGIWNDMNEPAISERPFGDEGGHIWFPLDALQGPLKERTTHAEAHNLYGLGMAQAAWEGLAQLRPQQRSFVLSRSGFAGIQRWSAVWTGDNQSLWEYLESSLPMLCNLGLSGVAFVGADIGGFAGNATRELFARWMQAGLLYPLMRAHSSMGTERHEPWVFGPEVEALCRQAIELRYQLLPYLYSLFWEASQTGAPVLRPLLYHYPDDVQTYQLTDQVMLGPSLLAAPVVRPGITARAVYLPSGTWYDWWSGEPYSGGECILAQAPLDRMPLFVKAGAIIPLQPVMQYVDEQPLDQLTVRIWPGLGEWTLYEDDGSSFAYQQGMGATTHYRVIGEEQQGEVEIAARQGAWSPSQRQVTIELVGLGEQKFQDDGQSRRLVFHPSFR